MDTCITKLAAAAGLVVAMIARPVSAQTVYWTDDGVPKIQRLDLTGMDDLVTRGITEPRGIALDLAGGKMYWADRANQRIQRANLDGSSVQNLITSGLTGPAGIALDVAGGKMYWTDMLANSVQRANMDGTGPVDTLVVSAPMAFRIALDVDGDRMYWTEGSGMPRIRRATLSGASIETVVDTGLSNPRGIDLDLFAGKVYWAEFDLGKVQRANLDGTDVEDVVTGLAFPAGLALDAARGKVYWTSIGSPSIQRANLDGTDVQDLAITGLSAPREVALDVDIPDPACPHDIDDSGDVAVVDLLDLLGSWGICP